MWRWTGGGEDVRDWPVVVVDVVVVVAAAGCCCCCRVPTRSACACLFSRPSLALLFLAVDLTMTTVTMVMMMAVVSSLHLRSRQPSHPCHTHHAPPRPSFVFAHSLAHSSNRPTTTCTLPPVRYSEPTLNPTRPHSTPPPPLAAARPAAVFVPAALSRTHTHTSTTATPISPPDLMHLTFHRRDPFFCRKKTQVNSNHRSLPPSLPARTHRKSKKEKKGKKKRKKKENNNTLLEQAEEEGKKKKNET